MTPPPVAKDFSGTLALGIRDEPAKGKTRWLIVEYTAGQPVGTTTIDHDTEAGQPTSEAGARLEAETAYGQDIHVWFAAQRFTWKEVTADADLRLAVKKGTVRIHGDEPTFIRHMDSSTQVAKWFASTV